MAVVFEIFRVAMSRTMYWSVSSHGILTTNLVLFEGRNGFYIEMLNGTYVGAYVGLLNEAERLGESLSK